MLTEMLTMTSDAKQPKCSSVYNILVNMPPSQSSLPSQLWMQVASGLYTPSDGKYRRTSQPEGRPIRHDLSISFILYWKIQFIPFLKEYLEDAYWVPYAKFGLSWNYCNLKEKFEVSERRSYLALVSNHLPHIKTSLWKCYNSALFP